jgi:hypothetical protein
MILAAVLSLLVAAGGPQEAPPTAEEIKTARENFERAQQVYRESCEERAYGAYDDLCDQLKKEVRRSQLVLDDLEHRAPQPKGSSAGAGGGAGGA